MTDALLPAVPGAPIRRPTLRFMLQHPAHLIALGLGSGLSPIAPGTVGTLWAWLSFGVVQHYSAQAPWGWILLIGALVGWWACTVTAKHMAVPDPSSIVWDEILAFWLILWLITPATWWAQWVAFALFRFFDAVKPGPVAWADQLFKGARAQPVSAAQGFGILLDDAVAALCTLLVIASWRWF